MSVGTAIVRTCKECGNEFPHTVKGAGRLPDLCSPTCKVIAHDRAVQRYRQTDKYKESTRRGARVRSETYDPWKWENTILEWDE